MISRSFSKPTCRCRWFTNQCDVGFAWLYVIFVIGRLYCGSAVHAFEFARARALVHDRRVYCCKLAKPTWGCSLTRSCNAPAHSWTIINMHIRTHTHAWTHKTQANEHGHTNARTERYSGSFALRVYAKINIV